MTQAYSNKALPPGTVLREWRLEQVLGVGGFGIVYKGRGLYFDELVAIKEYFPSAISDRRDGDTVVPNDSESEEIHALGLKKFVEEAKLLWNLSKPTRHPNIVSVRSLFEIHGTAYIVMDFEDGVSLSQMLKEGKTFTEATLRPLLFPIAEGLDRAHRVGVVHRDIKPPNILVSDDGRPVLIDFGSARFDSGQATSTKVTFHTPPYAAIEQYVKTYDQGPWTDIYALGVVLYECVAGEKPPEVLERLHGNMSKPLAEGDWPGYSKPFLRAIDVAMIIKPNERPQSIPQWLAMFDAPGDAPLEISGDDAPTRFAAFQGPPDEIVPVADPRLQQETPSVAAAAPAKPVEAAPAAPAPATAQAKPKEAAKPVTDRAAAAPTEPKTARGKKKGKALPIAIAAGLVAVVGGALLLSQGKNSGVETAIPGLPETDVGVISGEMANIAAPVPTAAAGTDAGGLANAIDALAADVRRSGRLGGQVGRLNAASAQLKTLAGELATLSSQPQSAAQAQAHSNQMRAVATAAAAQVAQAAASEADRLARNASRSAPAVQPGGSGASARAAADIRSASAQIEQARARAAAAAASARGASDPVQAVNAARQGLGALAQLGSAQSRITRSAAAIKKEVNVLPQKQQEFAGIDAAARASYQRVLEMARTGKPGLFASGQRRDGWRVRQDNAAKAKAYLPELDQLVRSMHAATTVAAADGLLAQVRSMKRNIDALEASSSAAMPKRGQQASEAEAATTKE